VNQLHLAEGWPIKPGGSEQRGAVCSSITISGFDFVNRPPFGQGMMFLRHITQTSPDSRK